MIRRGVSRRGGIEARRFAGLALAGTALTGCTLVQPQAIDKPVPAGPLAAIRPAPDGGLPIECRGMPTDRCLQVGSGVAAGPGAIRIIVSCEILVCTEDAAAFRLDSVDAKGVTTGVGRGLWGNAEQP